MKNRYFELLLFGFCFISCTTLNAQFITDSVSVESILDEDFASTPITEDDKGELCSLAYQGGPYYDGLPAILDLILLIESIEIEDYKALSTTERNVMFKKLWEEKYCQVYCNQNKPVIGPLDAIGLYEANDGWVLSLYNPQVIAADPNIVRLLNAQDPTITRYGTIVDYLFNTANSNSYSMRNGLSHRNDILGYMNVIKSWDGKSIKDFTEEEKEKYLPKEEGQKE